MPLPSSKVVLILTLGLFLTMVVALPAVPTSAAAPVGQVTKTQSGLVTYDSLTGGNAGQWVFGGSAVPEGGSWNYYENSQGLHIGVASPDRGEWAGYFASRGEQAQVFHAVVSLPSMSVSGPYSFNTGLYVQTGGQDIDYVTCDGTIGSGGYIWQVVQATGNTQQALAYSVLWSEPGSISTLTQECTIITNGQNELQVYLGGSLVYSSDSLSLGYQYPLTAFLEVETTSPSMHYSVYRDYYATTSDDVTVKGALAGSTVQLVAPSGRVIATATAGLSGTAVISLGGENMPLLAYVRVSVLGLPAASSAGPVQVWGGDVYTVSLL